MRLMVLTVTALTLAGASVASAEPADAAKAPDSITVLFQTGSAAVTPQEAAKLDQAARLYRDGKPLLMTVAGSADSVGNPVANLRISQRRADAVFQGLVDRGIPAERFQVVAKGETQPAVETSPGVPEARNRAAVITWK